MFPAEKDKTKKQATKSPTPPKSGPLENSDLSSALLKTLLCPSKDCSNYVYPPIKQCRSGHALCSTCAKKGSCTECGATLLEVPNLALEAIAKKLLKPCKYSCNGCPVTIPTMSDGNELSAYEYLCVHEYLCAHRKYNCFAAKCSWSGEKSEILGHMEMHHKERVVIGTEKVFKIKKLEKREELDMMFLFVSDYGDFWGKLKYKKEDSSFYGAVQYIGPLDSSSNYKYSFQMNLTEDNSERHFRFSRKTHPDVIPFEKVFETKDCFHVGIEVVKYFADNDKNVSIKLNIQPKE